jgi:NADPH:quinone reductase-like Zn-dependent oxidoreductase
VKAAVYTGYGSPDVIRVIDVDKPAPRDDEVLIKVVAAGISAPDWRVMRGSPVIVRAMFGLTKPRRRPSSEVAGTVEAIGSGVRSFKIGDAVFGVCKGAGAEYACGIESNLVLKPESVTFEEAASAPVSAFTALQGLRDKGGIKAGQRVLVNGASGGVGTFAVQVAKSFGATVTGVCSPRNVDMVRSIGADRVIDYTQEDFIRDGQRYDMLFDVAGSHSWSDCKKVLTPRGTHIVAGVSSREKPTILPLLFAPVASRFRKQKLVSFISKHRNADLIALKEFMEAGKLTPVIDRMFPLRDVPEAIRYLGEGHPRAKIVIAV